MTAVRRLITILMLSLAATALFAQETQAPRATEAITAETDRDVNDPRAMRLTLEGAMNTALQQNLGVELQTYEYRISGQNLRSQYGVYDWYTDANVRHWFYQHEWVVTGAKFGWFQGSDALKTLIRVDDQVVSSWGIGSRSRAVAASALREVEAKQG